jgi:high potential iron-sulfur protein
MTDTLSRRTIVLFGSACAAGSISLFGRVKEAHAAKFPQTSPVVLYQPSPKDGHQCDGCTLFQSPDACQVVDGTISPTGWCKLWVKKAS